MNPALPIPQFSIAAIRKLILWILWIGFTAYTIWLAPVDRPETWAIGWRLLTFQWQQLNAYIPAIFWMMGVTPMIYACLMFADGRMQPIRAWPYFVGANFTGVMCLLPYLIFRQRSSSFSGSTDRWLALLDRRSTGLALLVISIMLLSYAVLAGNWQDYVEQFRSVAFVHLLSLDFCCMCLIFPIATLLDDDMLRRGITHRLQYHVLALVPLFGALLYLCLRPPLSQSKN